ncbi:MAG: M48 family metalloprotease [Desulfobacteraceae bacterium]|nr:M48 family metalloprotease [Desulfobacteraceae bacterium]
MLRTIKIIAWFLVICLMVRPPLVYAGQMTVSEEKELAEEFLETVRRNFTIIEDPVIHNYVNELGQSIVSVLPPQPFEYKFYVIDQDGVNAFAGPAGNIFIFSGLFEVMDSEGELAGIIAHEIAHVSARHIAELLEKSKKSQIVSATGMIAGILLGLGGASAVGSALAIGSAAAGQSMILAYTRENEMEADFLGRRYLEDAGYSLYGLQRALEKIRAREWYGEKEIPTYLKTHPATRERLANLNNMLADRPAAEPEENFAFRRAQAALTGLYEDTDKAVKKFKQKISRQDTDAAAFYGLALALAQGGRPEAALEKIKKAVSLKPSDPYFKIALGRISFMAGKYEEAEKTLAKIDNLKDYGAEGLFYLARSRISSGDCKGAVSALEILHENFPDHKEALYFLGQCKGEQGRLGEAHYYLGMHYSKNGEFETARFHFKRAMEKAADIKLEEKINKEMEKLRDREKENKRRQQEEENSGTY